MVSAKLITTIAPIHHQKSVNGLSASQTCEHINNTKPTCIRLIHNKFTINFNNKNCVVIMTRALVKIIDEMSYRRSGTSARVKYCMSELYI
ncbi:MAG: hypothetical protein ACI8SC_002797 [Colwellia sp.]|jgi:hypothetical protein